MARQRPGTEVSDIKNKRILVVDDHALLSNVVREVLAVELSCEVQVVGCASDALSQMAVQPLTWSSPTCLCQEWMVWI